MTKTEYDALRRFICGGHNCSDCPIDKYVPCSELTPEEELVRYAREEFNSRPLKTIYKILVKYARGVMV